MQAKCFHNQQETENAFQEFIEPQSIDFYATGINKLISLWQKCVDYNGSYLLNKDVLSLVKMISSSQSETAIKLHQSNKRYFLTHIQISQETCKVVWYSHLLLFWVTLNFQLLHSSPL